MRRLIESLTPPLLLAAARSVKHAIAGRPIDRVQLQEVASGPATGLRLLLPFDPAPDTWNSRIVAGLYEAGLIEVIAAAAGPGRVLYDVGAHIGLITCLWARHGGRTIAFEPNPVNADLMQRAAAANRLDEVEIRQVALADSEGQANLFIDHRGVGRSSAGYLEGVGGDVSGLTRSDEQGLSVWVTTLDSLLARGELPPPALIKIDVEGAECAVIRGAVTTIRTHRPTLIVEVHNVWAGIELTGLLAPLGYRVENLSPGANWPQTIWKPA